MESKRGKGKKEKQKEKRGEKKKKKTTKKERKKKDIKIPRTELISSLLSLGLCSNCGKMILDTKMYKQSSK